MVAGAAAKRQENAAEGAKIQPPVPKGYKRTELGVIPEGWNFEIGEQVTTLIGKGGSPRWQGFGYTNIGMLFITSENVRDGYLDIREPKYLPLEFHEKLKRTKIQKYDILINLVGASIGRSCQVTKNLGDANINQAVAVFRVREHISSVFIACYFQAPETIKRILEMQVDAARPNISLGNLRQFLILLPSFPEQQAIAEALSDVDSWVAALDALIAKKRAIKTATMQQLLTGRTRLAGFSGEWEENTFGELFDFLPTANNSRADLTYDYEVKYIHYGDIHTQWDYFVDFHCENIPSIHASKIGNAAFLKEGDLIIADASEDYEGVGKSIEVKGLGASKAVAGLHTFLLRAKDDKVAIGFRSYIQSIGTVKTAVNKIATGLKVYGISKNNLKDVPILLPPPEEQTAIATILSDMDAEIEMLEAKREKASALKQGMMQELLTGKTRLV